MLLNDPPLQQPILGPSGFPPQVWGLWFARIVNVLKNFESANDITITDATKGLVLTAPNATQYRVTVSNAGALVITAI